MSPTRAEDDDHRYETNDRAGQLALAKNFRSDLSIRVQNVME